METDLYTEHFVSLKDLSFEQAEKILQVQKQKKFRRKKVWEIAVDLGFLDPKTVNSEEKS